MRATTVATFQIDVHTQIHQVHQLNIAALGYPSRHTNYDQAIYLN